MSISSFSPLHLSLNAYGRLSESALTLSFLKQDRQFKNPLILHHSPHGLNVPLSKAQRKMEALSAYTKLHHCTVTCRYKLHTESGRKTKKRKKKEKRNWVTDKRASSGVGLGNVFITAQKGFEECFS